MQVRPDQLARSLDERLYPAYLVSGDEPLQVMEALDAIRAACRRQDYLERDVFDIDKDFDWRAFIDNAASMSLFSSRKMLECRMPGGKPGREGSAVLKDYLAQAVEDQVLIIATGKLDKGSKAGAWFKALDKAGVVVSCWPIQGAELQAWLRQRFAARGMQAEGDVLHYLAERVEGNLLAADQEIEKLYLSLGPGNVDIERLREAVSDNSRYSIFELVDSALDGDSQRVHKIIDSLIAEGAEPIVVNWALAKDIRLLAAVAGEPRGADPALARAGVWKSRLALFKRCLGRHQPMLFPALLTRCSRIDQFSKGVLTGNAWDELRFVGSRLSSRTLR